MGVAKYSPTVSHSYSVNQDWFEENGGGFGNGIIPESQFDDQGYDMYGYHGYTERDRAGYTENDYLEDSIEDEVRGIYDNIYKLWSETITDLSAKMKIQLAACSGFNYKNQKLIDAITLFESARLECYRLNEAYEKAGKKDALEYNESEFRKLLSQIYEKIVEFSEPIEDFYSRELNK